MIPVRLVKLSKAAAKAKLRSKMVRIRISTTQVRLEVPPNFPVILAGLKKTFIVNFVSFVVGICKATGEATPVPAFENENLHEIETESETKSPSGLKRPLLEDSDLSQKKVKTDHEEENPEEKGQSPEQEEQHPEKDAASPAAEPKQASAPPESALKQAPSTPSNQHIGANHMGAMSAQQHHHTMGYPSQMMGGMFPGQYPMHGYAGYPYSHGYPGQPGMMMGQQPGMMPPGSQTPTNHSLGGPQQPGGYFGQPGSGDGQPPMGTPPGGVSNRYSGGFQQMPMQMPMHMMPYGPQGMFFSPYPTAMMNPMMAQPFHGGGTPHNPHASGGRSNASQQQSYVPTPPPPRSAGTPLALSCDDEQLSEYQMLVRKQLEVFEAQPEDVESNTQGRKKQVVLGQVSGVTVLNGGNSNCICGI
jgi:hypothetical protein